jgi:hypothetical protein
MSFEARCPQCVFLSRQLGQRTACLLHVSLAAAAADDEPVSVVATGGDYDEPYVFGRQLTADRPGPFTLRQYVRLLLLRSRVQEARLDPDQDAPDMPSSSQEEQLSRR